MLLLLLIFPINIKNRRNLGIMSRTLHMQRPPLGTRHVETTTRLVSCCPWKTQRYYVRKLACYGKKGFCNADNCWTWLEGDSKHSHETEYQRTMCTGCKGKGYFETITVNINRHSTYNSTGTINRNNCFQCQGRGFFGGHHKSNCLYCHLHCPKKNE